jgi:hypothetical protein
VNVRIAAVSVASAALVAVGATSAVAAPAPAGITLKANHSTVKLGDVVTFTGKTTGLKEGSKVTLQVKSGATWKSLPVTAKVNHGAYKLTDKFQKKGVQVLRVKDGAAVSKGVSVTVR